MEPIIIQNRKGLQAPDMVRKILLICGILSSLLYIAMNIFVAMLRANYSSASQTVSELSAIDAPTRSQWVSLSIVYTDDEIGWISNL